jgi:hypothetical protein
VRVETSACVVAIADFARHGLETGVLGDRSSLVAQRLPIPLWIVCCPYSDSAIWKVVTSPSRLSYRPPGSVLESRCGSLTQALKADPPNWLTAEAVRYCQGRMARSLVAQSGEKASAEEGSALPVASQNRLAASTR